MPFTSPMLAGARLRLLERRADLVVPHPGGARGVYIFALGSLGEFCAPTLHDIRLADRLRHLQSVSPQGVRLVARATAIEGAAGRKAAAAAAEAAARDTRRRQDFEAALLHCGTLAGADSAAAEYAGVAAPGAQLRALALAGSTARSADAVLADLGTLAQHLAAAGLDLPPTGREGAPPGRCTQVMDMMADTARQIRAWINMHAVQAGTVHESALGVAESLDTMQAAARVLHAGMPALTDNPVTLLNHWTAAPDQLVARIGRTALMLDGWQQVCLLWRVADDDAARLDALLEAATVLPPFPAEGEAWIAERADLVRRLAQMQSAPPAARPGGRMPSEAVALIARNERMRGLAA